MLKKGKLAELTSYGVSIWLDDLSRERIRSGDLQKRIAEDSVVGVTTNPAIFAAAIGDGTTYADQLQQLARAGVGAEGAVVAMTSSDVQAACEFMAPVFTATGGQNGRVSIEVDPRLSREAEQTIAQAKELRALVDRPNVMIKIPATPESLGAIAAATAAGISVNVTLIFSVDQYRAVAAAYAAGLEEAYANGIDLRAIHSVASVFVSRLDTMIDPLLSEIGTPEALAMRSRAGVANARLAYQAYEEFCASDRWRALEAAGANRQRPLWASTGVKDPALSPTLYVDQLAVAQTVNTMPEATLRAVAEQAQLTGDTVHPYLADAAAVMAGLAAVGVNLDEVMARLLHEGVEKFEVAWNALLAQVDAALEAAR